MPDWSLFSGDSKPRLKELHRHFLEMLQDGRHMFDAASGVLLSGGDPKVVREDLFSTDQRINRTQQALRRAMVVHGTVYGTSSFPALLVLMSLAKDAERIGDYAKNIYGLAADGAQLPSGERRNDLIELKDTVSKLLVRAHGVFQRQNDVAAATAFLEDADAVQKRCDADLRQLFAVTGRNVAGEVLLLRFFKRISSHCGNIVTSIVMPLDKLDFYPGKPESEQ